MDNGMKVVTNGTDNHMLLVDLTQFGKGKGIFAQESLDEANITLNKNTIPADPSSPFYPSGVRMGTPSLTTRGMKEKEMEQIGEWIVGILKEPTNADLKKEIKEKVKKLTDEFPIYREFD